MQCQVYMNLINCDIAHYIEFYIEPNADISTGNNFGIGGFGNLVVPEGYVGGALNGTGTFTGTTLATLGVTVPGGPYLIQWGASGASETITLVVS